MDSTRDAVVKLGIELRELITGVDRSLGDVSDGGGLDDVTDDELPDGLVLGATTSTVCASHVLDVTASVFGTTSVASLLRHFDSY